MENRIATMIIERRLLVREALISLMATHSYHVVAGIPSTADIDNSPLAPEEPKLVILGAMPAQEATIAANRIRKMWPEAKIVLLFEHAASVDLRKLLASEIDGCIPLSASSEMLIGALQQIVAADLRMLILSAAGSSPMPRATGGREDGAELDLSANNLAQSDEVTNDAINGAFCIRISHDITEREEQILRGLVKGHSNKMIARTCVSREATVKVHVKSILRKIGVANRTQLAIWALENGYGAAVKDRAITAHAAQERPEHRQVEAT